MNVETLIYIGLFIGTNLLVGGMYFLIFGKGLRASARVNRRLSMIESSASRQDVLAKLRKDFDMPKSKLSLPGYALLLKQARLANITVNPTVLFAAMAAVGFSVFLALKIFAGIGAGLGLPVSIVAGVGAVYFFIKRRADARRALIEEQLPDAMEYLVRTLRVGYPIQAALSAVAKELPDPLGTEFGIVADEAAYGRDLGEGLRQMADRLDNQDLRFLAVAVAISQSSGGNLAEVLEGLSNVIRSRFKLFRRVKAITAEAKFSGKFLSSFPLLMLAAIKIMKPDYFDEVMQTSYFIPATLIVIAMMGANMMFMRMMVNIKV